MQQQRSGEQTETTLTELLGTYLQVSARYAPPSYSLRSVASAFDRWASQQPVSRLAKVYDSLVDGELEPNLEELELNASA